MTRLGYVLVFALAIISSSQASSFGDEIKDVLDKMVNEVEYLMERVKQFFEGMVDQKKIELTQITDLAVKQIDQDSSLDAACKEEVKKQLEAHKNTGVSSFFTCSNLTDAMVETGSVIVFSLELTANLTDNFNAIFGRLNGCSNEAFYDKPACWMKAVLDVKDDINKDMSDIAFFKTKVAKLTDDIRANIEYCANPPKSFLNSAVQHSKAASKNCQPKVLLTNN